MDINVGKSYHIKDEFFTLVNDKKLMSNKDGENYRPHFFFFSDPHMKGIYWAVPQSTKVEKYHILIQKKIEKYGKCNTILIRKFGGQDNAFLIQNMFPVIEKYVDHEHTIGGKSVNIHTETAKDIIANAKQVLSLYRKGVNLIFPDIDKIYNLMKKELESNL